MQAVGREHSALQCTARAHLKAGAMPSAAPSLSPTDSHVVAPGSSQAQVTTVAEGTTKLRLAQLSQMGGLREGGGGRAWRRSRPVSVQAGRRGCMHVRARRAAFPVWLVRPGARPRLPRRPSRPCCQRSAHLCGSTSANLYSTSAPAGSSSVDVHTSPSPHVMVGACSRFQAPSCSALPTSASDCPKLTCGRGGEAQGAGKVGKGGTLHACVGCCPHACVGGRRRPQRSSGRSG